MNLNFVSIKDWEYRSLCLNKKSLEILTGGQKLELRKQKTVMGKSDKKETSRPRDVNHNHHDLFSALRDLRNNLAKEKKLPSYIVFNDKSLHDMCNLLPRNDDEFLMVHGVGQNKLESYGKVFLRVIREYSLK
jgi:ATP-dependent DNA helicase RecQ